MITPTEHTITTEDGLELFYRAWKPSRPCDKALILLHRGHEHSGRMVEVVDRLNLRDIAVFAWDARGHGRSQGKRGYAESFSTYAADLDLFVRSVSKSSGIPIRNMAVMAHSVGAVIAAAWIHDFAPPIRGVVLGAPAFRVKLYVPFAIPLCRFLIFLKGKEKAYLNSYVKSWLLTHDREQSRRYDEDKLIERGISVNILLGLYDTSTRLLRDAGAIQTPVLILSAGSDYVVRVSAQKKFFNGLSSRMKEMSVIPGLYHALFHEKEWHLAIDPAREFIQKLFSRQSAEKSLLDADRQGYTKNEFDRLSKPLAIGSPASFFYGTQKMIMKTFGRLSRGIRIGWSTGFDSGRTLDYVYENTARGFTPLGRFFDRLYLNSVGWEGIRRRKENLQNALREAIKYVQKSGSSVRILDIASGPGRYALEILKEFSDISPSAVLKDYDQKNLEKGESIAQGLNLKNITFKQGDAFDPDSVADISPSATIAIVSGLYELFPENDILIRSLEGLSRALKNGGYLIYTGQPWHPQIDMIARVLLNREGKPWVMRRRTQEEMDELVRSAGFQKIGMRIDEFGIFSVSLARKGGRE